MAKEREVGAHRRMRPAFFGIQPCETTVAEAIVSSNMGNRCAGSRYSRALACSIAALTLGGEALAATPLWEYPTNGKIDSSPTLAWDGTIVIGSDDNTLTALNPDGSRRWFLQGNNWFRSTPAIARDGTVYIGDWDFYLYAIHPEEGDVLWTFETFNFISSSPAIGPDGTIYVGSGDFDLYAIDPTGSLRWVFPTDDWILSSPAIGPDGTIYFGSWDGYIYAVTPAGALAWEYFAGNAVFSSPAVGPGGEIYIGAGDSLLALSSSGFLVWEFETDGLVDSSPALGSDGTVYVGSGDGRLYSVDPAEGSANWSYPDAEDVPIGSIYSSPAVAANGDIFITARDGFLYSISAAGALNWSVPFDEGSDSSPLLGPEGAVYVGSRDKKLYAIAAGDRLASSLWPAFRGTRCRDGSPPDLYSEWIVNFELDPADEGPAADPAGDGLPNLLCYALGGGATVADRSLLPPVSSDSFSFEQDLRKADLVYQPQFSEDLLSWQDLEHELEGPATAVQARQSILPPESDRGFFRLKVTRF